MLPHRGRVVVLALAILTGACGPAPLGAPPSVGVPPSLAVAPSIPAIPAGSPAATPAAPVLNLAAVRDVTQAPRFLVGRWSASLPVSEARVTVAPAVPFACDATRDPDGRTGGYGCTGLLPAATDVQVTLTVSTGVGTGAATSAVQTFRTVGTRLVGVPWFSEFEDPAGEPLACAAASVRIIHAFTTGQDPLTATALLALGRTGNRSADPGLDPAAIAALLTRLEPTDRYHYYAFGSKDEATRAAAYWLARSAKPVIVISLAGQHAPVLTGFEGNIGTHDGDPANAVSALIVEDPQRGDLQPATQVRRPDKPRSVEFQTGKRIGLAEWNSDEWWLGYAYQGVIRMPDGSFQDIDRADGLYPRPHWGGRFVIIVDDGDADNPPDRAGRVPFARQLRPGSPPAGGLPALRQGPQSSPDRASLLTRGRAPGQAPEGEDPMRGQGSPGLWPADSGRRDQVRALDRRLFDRLLHRHLPSLPAA